MPTTQRHATSILAALLLALSPVASASDLRAADAAVKAAVSKSRTSLITRLMDDPHAYVRHRTAEAVAGQTSWPTHVTAPLSETFTACVTDASEPGFVRAACARALARLGEPGAVDAILSAIPSVDGETRYWLAESLRRIGSEEAYAELTRLRDDEDIFLAEACRQWTTAHQAQRQPEPTSASQTQDAAPVTSPLPVGTKP